MVTTASPQSRYRQGTWTVTKLKEELRNRNLSPAGKKTELIDRLERADRTGSAAPKDRRGGKGSDETGDSPSVVRTRSDSPSTRANAMTINQLKEELRMMGKSPVGKKNELMQRLQEAQASFNPFVEQAEQVRRPSLVRSGASPSRSSTKASTAHTITADDIGLLTSPITTLNLAVRCIFSFLADALDQASKKPLLYINLCAFLLLIASINLIDLPHQAHLRPIQAVIIWYSRWIILGILSSIGLGTGAHTFLLFLGPFIARVTTAAYVCKSVSFPLFGLESLLCPAGIYNKSEITIWMIMNKVKWESFAWGLGTAIGELPPYLIARASALAGTSSGEVKQVEQIAAKASKYRTWSETAQLASYGVVSRLGFFGILLCASIPNPLFDLAGITCGYFMIPFRTFAAATFIGKAVIKASIQSAFVVLLFSRDYLEHAVRYVQKTFPSWGKTFHEWILAQRTVFQERRPDPFMEMVGSVWHAFLLAMMGYFVVSAIRSFAIMQARRDSILKRL